MFGTMRLRTAFTAVIAAGVLLLATSGDGLAQKRGGTMKALINPEPPILVLGLSQNTPVQTVAGKMYSGLLTFGHDLKPIPSLAESVDVSADGLTYTFKLRRNVTWHDGKPFTAADVVFSTKTYLPETHPRARLNFARAETITATDDYTVAFKLKEPFPPFLYAFEVSSAPMMPRHIYEGTDFRNNPANQHPIGTGPFKFKEWKKGSFIHLVRNDNYWKAGQPYLDEIIFVVAPDASARVVALETGEVHLASFGDIELFEVPRLRKLPILEFTTKGYEFYAPVMWLDMNHLRKPFNDKRFRQAMLHAHDREFIRDKIFFGLGRVATGPINSQTNFYDADVKKYPFDVKRADELLDEMGLKKDAQGIRAKIEMVVLPYGEIWGRLAEYSKQAMRRVGIDVTLKTTDVAGFNQASSNFEYDTTWQYLFQFADPAIGVARSYISSNIRKGVMFSNTANYRNDKVDEGFAKGAVALTREERQKWYSMMQKEAVEDAAVGWMLEMEFPTFVNKKFKNVVTTAIGVNESFDGVWME